MAENDDNTMVFVIIGLVIVVCLCSLSSSSIGLGAFFFMNGDDTDTDIDKDTGTDRKGTDGTTGTTGKTGKTGTTDTNGTTGTSGTSGKTDNTGTTDDFGGGQTEPDPSPTRTYKLYDRMLVNGGKPIDMVSPGASIEDVKRRCDENPDCKGFQQLTPNTDYTLLDFYDDWELAEGPPGSKIYLLSSISPKYESDTPGPSITRDYKFFQGYDVPGTDIKRRADLANNISGLKRACDNLPGCNSFNTNGWLKRGNNLSSKKWTNDPNKGAYILASNAPSSNRPPTSGGRTSSGPTRPSQPSVNYKSIDKVLGSGNLLGSYGPDKSVDDLKRLCSQRADCKGFNVSGPMKDLYGDRANLQYGPGKTFIKDNKIGRYVMLKDTGAGGLPVKDLPPDTSLNKLKRECDREPKCDAFMMGPGPKVLMEKPSLSRNPGNNTYLKM